MVLNTPDALDLAQEVVSRFSLADLPHTAITELQELDGIGPTRATQFLAALKAPALKAKSVQKSHLSSEVGKAKMTPPSI